MALIQQRDMTLLGEENFLLTNELYNTVYFKDLAVMVAEPFGRDSYSFRMAKNAVDIVKRFDEGMRVEMWTGKAGEDHKIVSMDGDNLNIYYLDGSKTVSRDYALGRKNLRLILANIYLPKFMDGKNEDPGKK